MMQIPLQAVASQRLATVLAAQGCLLNVYQKADGMYVDLTLNDVPVLRTHAARNRIRLLLAARYFGFKGDLVFVDTQGDEQPNYAGLGSRWFLLYLTEAEVAES